MDQCKKERDVGVDSLPCPVCGDEAVHRPSCIWQEDEELSCPCCATNLRVMMDENGTDVWLVEIDQGDEP